VLHIPVCSPALLQVLKQEVGSNLIYRKPIVSYFSDNVSLFMKMW